ncbi:unnamed protein product [Medioppia subpectinata]|uniref:Uncharacterized protein n=1 Tax=Medioppia subpectinata TaxID=1979941 RepID=A0A7R9Q029_9ACAR|nr:unnamed protein product [Medioppia subpectinata]CAG2107686.1 unnamed protein product [Medioppia subpectinata]
MDTNMNSTANNTLKPKMLDIRKDYKTFDLCIEMSAEIDLKVIAWIRKQCKYLECLQINNSVLNTRLTSRQWIQIGEILSDNLIHLSINSVTNPEKLSEFSLIYLVQNFTKLEEFSFDVNDMPIDKIFTYFGPNLKTLKLNKCYKYRVSQNTFNILRQNAVNLETLEVEGYDIETLDLICNTFHELKSLNMFFFSSWLNMDSLSQLSQMPHLERLKIEFYQNRGVINYLAKTVFPNLHSLNLTGISFTPKLFEEFTHYFPNIRQLVLQNCSLLCDDRSDDFRDRQDCNDCKERVWKYLSKLTHLKQLSVNLLPRKDTGFSKSYVWTLNERSFPAIEELDFQWLPYDSKSFTENLLNPLNAFAKKHPKRQFKLRVNQDFFEFVSKKRQINGVKYNVMSSNIERNSAMMSKNLVCVLVVVVFLALIAGNECTSTKKFIKGLLLGALLSGHHKGGGEELFHQHQPL